MATITMRFFTVVIKGIVLQVLVVCATMTMRRCCRVVVVVSARRTLSLPLRVPHQAPPQPTPYPQQFSISFFTNISAMDDHINNSNNNNSNNNNPQPYHKDDNNNYRVPGKLWYDWKQQKAQRIDHAAGSYECVHFYHTYTQQCSLIFTSDGGMYRILHDRDEKESDRQNNHNNSILQQPQRQPPPQQPPPCCLDIAGLGPPPPDWASRADANATFTGRVHDTVSGLDAREWIFVLNSKKSNNSTLTSTLPFSNNHFKDSSSAPLPYHSMRQVALGSLLQGRPLTFTFPGTAKGRQDYHFDVTSFQVGPIDAALFEIPDSCRNQPCPRTIPSAAAPS